MHNEGIGYDRLQIRCADNIEKTVYFAYHLRKEKIMSESAIQKLRQGKWWQSAVWKPFAACYTFSRGM